MLNQIHPAQIRGARGMLDWSMNQLAVAAGVSVSTIKRIEETLSQPVSDAAYAKVRAAFETAGICFLDDMGEGMGMRFQPR